MQITIKHNFPAVQKQLDNLQKDIARQATASALNKTIAQAKTAMSREIRDEFNISAAKVNESLSITRASASGGELRMQASLQSPRKRGRSLNLINFMEKSVSMAQARKRIKAGEGGTYQLQGRSMQKMLELRFKIKRKGPAKVVKGAFIGNKGRTVFMREGKSRLPIKALQTIDVASMFNTKRVNAKVVQMMMDKFPTIFDHEAKFFTSKFNASKAA